MQIHSVNTLSVSMISNEGFVGYLLELASELKLEIVLPILTSFLNSKHEQLKTVG